jgi:hypothetical protein
MGKNKIYAFWIKKYQMLTEKVGFEPIDIICVVRRNQSSNTRIWHYRAKKFNFFLRGFKYLILAKNLKGKKKRLEIKRK